jgi:hypothetical protein
MGRSYQYRPETLILKPVTVVLAAASTNIDFSTTDIAPGLYYMSVLTKSAVTGTTTTAAFSAFTDAAQSQVSGEPIHFYDQPGNNVELITVDAGADGEVWHATFSETTTNPSAGLMGNPLPYGMRMVLTKGGATTGETLEITIMLQRVN